MKLFIPLANNVLVRRIKTDDVEETVGGIIVPTGSQPVSLTEEVIIVAISNELHLPNNEIAHANVGNRCLIHRGLNGVPVVVQGEELWLISYINLLGIVK